MMDELAMLAAAQAIPGPQGQQCRVVGMRAVQFPQQTFVNITFTGFNIPKDSVLDNVEQIAKSLDAAMKELGIKLRVYSVEVKELEAT